MKAIRCIDVILWFFDFQCFLHTIFMVHFHVSFVAPVSVEGFFSFLKHRFLKNCMLCRLNLKKIDGFLRAQKWIYFEHYSLNIGWFRPTRHKIKIQNTRLKGLIVELLYMLKSKVYKCFWREASDLKKGQKKMSEGCQSVAVIIMALLIQHHIVNNPENKQNMLPIFFVYYMEVHSI